MTSLITLYRRRGTVLLLVTSTLLAIILALVLFRVLSVPEFATESVYAGNALLQSLFYPFAQAVALSFWGTLSLLLGVVWSRTLFGSNSLIETFLVGSLLGTTSIPLMYAGAQLLLPVISNTFLPFRLELGTHPQVYGLTTLFFMVLIGLMLLIGREVIKAAHRQPM